MSEAELGAELRASPERFALIDGATDRTASVVDECERLMGAPRCHVGAVLCAFDEPPTAAQAEALLAPHPVLVDLELLFAPELHIDPLMLLRSLRRRGLPRIALWPGHLAAGRARFSAPQRPDFYEQPCGDVLVLRPRDGTLPGERCFEVERWPG
jgi:hypothetical protein